MKNEIVLRGTLFLFIKCRVLLFDHTPTNCKAFFRDLALGLPQGSVPDTSRADRILVPVGNNGMAVYQVNNKGTAKLKTTLIKKVKE